MSEAKFTKGPWVVYLPEDNHGSQNYDEIVIGMDSYNSSPMEFYTCHRAIIEGYDDDGEAEANAHLIAAAPELYGMLATAANILAGDDAISEVSADDIKSLLSKARGEQPKEGN